jgi:CRISPR-associated protein Csd1
MWEKEYKQVNQNHPIAICSITNKKDFIPKLWEDKIKGVPKVEKGCALVSANTGAIPSFSSHGFDNNENARVGLFVARAASCALNYLLNEKITKIDKKGKPYPFKKYAIKISDDSVFTCWTNKQGIAGIIGKLSSGNMIETEKVLKFLQSTMFGKVLNKNGNDEFFTLMLAGNTGRIAVRSFQKHSVRSIISNIVKFFDDAHMYKEKTFSIKEILNSLKLSDKKNISNNLSEKLFDSAFNDKQIPQIIFNNAIFKYQSPSSKWWHRNICASVIKLKLIRDGKDIKEMLDENRNDMSYLLGRLFAVYEHANKNSNNGKNKDNDSFRNRYFKKASCYPLLIFPTFEQMFSHWKINGKTRYDCKLDEIFKMIGGESKFPKNLCLQEQSVFILGYHHQRSKFFEKSNEQAEDVLQDLHNEDIVDEEGDEEND